MCKRSTKESNSANAMNKKLTKNSRNGLHIIYYINYTKSEETSGGCK